MIYFPKTNWNYNDVLTENDMNRIEEGIAEGRQLIDAHAADKNNPHGVTVSQIGAETPAGAQAKVDAHSARTDNPHGVTAAQVGAETPFGVQAKVDTAVDSLKKRLIMGVY